MLSLGTPNGQLVNYHGILDGAKFAYQSIIDRCFSFSFPLN